MDGVERSVDLGTETIPPANCVLSGVFQIRICDFDLVVSFHCSGLYKLISEFRNAKPRDYTGVFKALINNELG